jgi:hypothetical protein
VTGGPEGQRPATPPAAPAPPGWEKPPPLRIIIPFYFILNE